MSMFDAANALIEKIAPVVQSVGCSVTLERVDGDVAVVRLDRPYHLEVENTVRIQHFVERELREAVPGLSTVTFELPEPEAPFQRTEVEISAVVPAETADTCVITLDRTISDASRMYTSAAEADDPLIQRLFGVPHVDAVMAKDRMLIISRQGGTWPVIVDELKSAIRAHFSGAGAPTAGIEQAIWNKVWILLDEQVNPAVASHGGNIELVEVKGTEVWLHMGGGCQGCSAAAVTLRQGVERAIREAVPEVTAIHDATDHDSGANPYYA